MKKTFLLLFFLLLFEYVIFNFHNLKTTYQDFGDAALLCIKINFAKEFKEYLGAYSRMGFFHPGPILFYFYAFLDVMISKFDLLNDFKSKSNVYGIFQFALNFALLFFSYSLLPKNISKTLRIIFIVIVLLFYENLAYGFTSNLFSIWGPFSIIIPFFVLLISLALVYETHNYSLFPVIFLMNSIVINNHLSGIIYSGIFTFLFLIIIAKKCKNYKSFVGWLTIATVVLMFSFLPPILEFFWNFPDNNILKIIEISKSTTSLRKGKEVFLYFFELISIFTIGKPNFFIGIIIFFSIIITIEYFKRQVDISFLKTLYIIANIQTFLLILYIFKIPFDLLHYLSWFYLAVFSLYVFIFFNYIFQFLEKEVYFRIFLTFLVVGNVFQLYKKANSPIFDYQKENLILQEVFKQIPIPNYKVYKITWGFGDEHHQNWVFASGLIFKLIEKKIPVCVDKEWLFMFGKHFLCVDTINNTRKTISIKKNSEIFLEPTLKKDKENTILYYYDYKIVFEP